MFKLISLVTLQSALLAASQIFLKKALIAFGPFQWSFHFFKNVFTNLSFAMSGLTIAAATLIWFFVLKRFDFSMAYPLISISYIFGVLAARFVFHETIPLTRWIGVLVIIVGVFLVVQK